MNDLEREIRELLDEDARHAPPPHEPRGPLRRARRRQLLTITAAGAAIALVTAAAFAGVRTIRRTDVPLVAPELTVGTLNGITVTYPVGWSLVDPIEAGLEPPPQPGDAPRLLLFLSGGEGDTSQILGCPGLNQNARGGMVLTVQEQPLALTGEASAAWPVELRPMDVGASESGCYPDWAFYRAGWTAAGRTFEARVGIGPDATAADRAALFDAFSSMTFEPSNGPSSVVLATGTAGGETWELIASGDRSGFELMLQGQSRAMGIGGFSGGEQGDVQTAQDTLGIGAGAQTVLFGETSRRVARLELILDGDPPLPVEIIDVPRAFTNGANAFVVVAESGRTGTLNAYDAAGDLLQSVAVNSGLPIPTTGPSGGSP